MKESLGSSDDGAIEERRQHVNGVLVEAAIVEEEKLMELPLKNGGVRILWP